MIFKDGSQEAYMMKRYLILGGTRFIGFHLAQKLLAEGHDVFLLNRGKTRPPAKFVKTPKHIFGNRNTLSAKTLEPVFSQKIDAVFDLSGFNPDHLRTVLEPFHSQIGHYVFCSSAEASSQLPIGTYGGDKARAEEFLQTFASRYSKFSYTCFRPQGVMGVYDGLFATFVFLRLFKSRPVLVSSQIKAGFVDVRDLVQLFISSTTNPRARNQIYNVVGDELVDIKKFSMICACALHLPLPRFLEGAGIPWVDFEKDFDNSKLKKDFEIKLKPLIETLHDVGGWLQKNPPPSAWKKLYWFLRV